MMLDPVMLLGALALALIVAGIALKLRPAPKPTNSIYAAHKAGLLKLGGKGPNQLSVVASATAAEHDARPSVRLLYGTQTGTAERFAKQLGAELRARYGGEKSVRVEVTDAEHYYASGAALDERLEKENVLLLLFATYGDGEPTDNAADLYSWITTEVDEVEGGAKNAYLHVSGGVEAVAAMRARLLSAAAGRQAPTANTPRSHPLSKNPTQNNHQTQHNTQHHTKQHSTTTTNKTTPKTEPQLWRLWPGQQAVRALQRRGQAPARRAGHARGHGSGGARRRRRRRLHRRRL